MTRVDLFVLNTNDKLAAIGDAREEAYELRKPVRIAFYNRDNQRKFLDVEITGIAIPDGFTTPLYLVTRRPGEFDRLIRVGDLLGIEVLK